MATDWIKMRVNLPDDPRVRFIAKQIKCHVVSAIGCLYMLWSLADQQTTDGTLWTYTASDLDRRVGREGFAKACAHKDVDWLLIEEDRLVIKRFEDHNGASAKARAQTAKRVRKHREEVTGVTPQPLPEKKRRDKNTGNATHSLTGAMPPIPDSLNTPEFIAAWNRWITHRAQIRSSLKPLTAEGQLKWLCEIGPHRAIAAIENSIVAGWRKLVEPIEPKNGRSHGNTHGAGPPGGSSLREGLKL